MDVQTNYVNVIVIVAFMGQMCIQTTSPTNNKTLETYCIFN